MGVSGEATLAGSFRTSLRVSLRTGEGFVSGMVKWDPVTGAYGPARVEDYPVRCELSRAPTALVLAVNGRKSRVARPRVVTAPRKGRRFRIVPHRYGFR